VPDQFPVDIAVSPGTRSIMRSLRQRHQLSDTQIATALLSWFANLTPDEQQRILESDAALRAGQELLQVRRLND
jgi:hypothetical protein